MSDETASKEKPTTAYLVWAALALLAFAGLVLRLQRAWEDMPQLIARTVPDDSFYYFQIARNIMHGEGATLDGETVTNGFHPLWLAVITPLFAFDDRDLPVHLALTLGAVLGAMTILLVFDVVRRLTATRLAALLAAGFFSLHPAIVSFSVNGLETSLGMFMLAIVCWLFVIAAQKTAPRSLSTYAVLGTAGALMSLARMDMGLVLVCTVGYLAIGDWRASRTWRGPALAAGIAALWIAPWLLWGWAATGSPVPDSAIAGGVVDREAFLATNNAASDRVSHGWDQAKLAFYERLPQQFMLEIRQRVWPFWTVVGLLCVAVAVVPGSRRSRTLSSAGLLAVPLAGLATALLYEAGIRWFVRTWYYAPFSLFAAFAVGLAAFWVEGIVLDARAWLDRKSRADGNGSRWQIPAWSVTAVVYTILGILLLYQYGPQREEELVYGYPWQVDVYATGAWVEGNTSTDARIGAYNAGIPAYLWNRTVINLDGVVNRDAYHALKNCATRDYIREEQIDYVADSAGQLFLTDCALSVERDLTEIAVIGGILPVHVLKPKDAP